MWWTSGGPVGPVRGVPYGSNRAVAVLSAKSCNVNIDTDFRSPLKLHYPAIMDYKLDRPVAERLERQRKLSDEACRQRQRVFSARRLPSRLGGQVSVHIPIYSIDLIE